ncbi:MAG: Asp-tRNA(Asn)/Glu-tRNA(Gln) amidotransferase subunit GatB [Parcubacteria group bacterium]|nr:Asp-tRNA(Asn)/Glu-tRNA(Gln) amidotransferase subunit GatB [Parcubacteria group bacterium]
MASYEVVIGLETHVQLKTQSKMFCTCVRGGDDLPPNVSVCPVCMGHPGTLPVTNRQAIEWGIKMALALGCEIPVQSKFDRKHYFYPDLPKGYQISQFDQPIGINGKLMVTRDDGQVSEIGIERLHLEEDAAKLLHSDAGSLVDYNRAGTPLMEIVTKPHFRHADEAKAYLQELRAIARYMGVSDADMEKGQLRCDVNISLRPVDWPKDRFSPKTEIKNVNSFRAVERAIKYEIARQTELWNEGKAPMVTTTRGWNDALQATEEQRTKEDAADYRYFPDPDLPPLRFVYGKTAADAADVIDVQLLEVQIPELPAKKRQRFTSEYSLTQAESNALVYDQALAGYFENIVSELQAWVGDTKGMDWEKEKGKLVKSAAGWLTSKLLKLLADKGQSLADTKATPENFAELIVMLQTNAINSSTGQKVLEFMNEKGGDPSNIVADNNWGQISDTGALDAIVAQVINANAKSVADYKAGKQNALQFLLGQVMKESKGKANPQTATELLKKSLEV